MGFNTKVIQGWDVSVSSGGTYTIASAVDITNVKKIAIFVRIDGATTSAANGGIKIYESGTTNDAIQGVSPGAVLSNAICPRVAFPDINPPFIYDGIIKLGTEVYDGTNYVYGVIVERLVEYDGLVDFVFINGDSLNAVSVDYMIVLVEF